MLLDLDLSAASVIVVGPPEVLDAAAKRIEMLAAGVIRVASRDDAVDASRADAPVLVDVTAADPEWADAVGRLATGRVVIRLRPSPPGGRIVLVGGGPGVADLQTVRAREELFAADVVFTDRLATHDDHSLIREAAPAARIVDVGKRPGHHRLSQRQIEAQMVAEAQAGNYVVRLKGGDPFVFGRGGEELAAAKAAGVPVSVVAGVTAAISVPEAAHIPVTYRSVTRAFTVISGHDPFTEAECRHLAALGGTIVVLMGVGSFVQCATGLINAGLDPATPFAAIERGYTPSQRVIRGTMRDAAQIVRLEGVKSPAVIVIGEVADLPELR